MDKLDKKKVVLYSLLLFVILSSVFVFTRTAVRESTNEVERKQMIEQEEHTLASVRNVVSSEMYRMASDLMFLTDVFIDYGSADDGYETVKSLWSDFAGRESTYDQIRFIDAQGDEVIRINYDAGMGVATEAEELQNKSGRYYFEDSIVLPEGEIYVSKLDLNMEKGVVELPYKPMIRMATPVYGEDGAAKGIVIVNYSAKYMLQYLDELASTAVGELYMMNPDGYWFYNEENSAKEWDFMFTGGEDVTFAAEFPEAWRVIKDLDSGTVWADEGIFVYKTITPLGEGAVYKAIQSHYNAFLEEDEWILVSYLHPDNNDAQLFFTSYWDEVLYTIQNNILILALIAGLSVFLAIFILIRKAAVERTKYFSEYDTMTGVLNRRAGMELLKREYRYARETGEALSICFADVNGLKQVNDVIGHEAGDELITGVVEVVKRHIRQTDFVVRMGGDEFLIVLKQSGAQEAESVWQRIAEEFERINREEKRRYLVSVSHGIETFSVRADENMDDVISAADQKMYEEKREIKKTLSVIRG
jgi:diguanylate cyclase (GGDEF)-like protein